MQNKMNNIYGAGINKYSYKKCFEYYMYAKMSYDYIYEY